jgi:hypothetical protein
MAITQAICTSFKQELLVATHNFTNTTGDVFKMALFTSSATLGASTATYDGTNEVANGNGYTTGGFTLTNVTPSTTGTKAITDWSVDPNWTTATFTARGAQVYNSSKSNKSVLILDFGADKNVSSGTFTVVLPTADGTNAILRLE